MAGGTGTGLLLVGVCNVCEFKYQEEIEPTDENVQGEINSAKKEHFQTGCQSPLVLGIRINPSYRIDLSGGYQLPSLVLALLVK